MDSFSITIISIVVVSFFSAFINGRKRDRCLKKINGYIVDIYNAKEKIIWGRTEIESNSITIEFDSKKKKFILYKNEFKNMQLIFRLHSHFDQKQKEKHSKVYNKILNPSLHSKLRRKLSNTFATAKDAVAEIVNVFMASAKTKGPMKSFTAQTKQIDRLKNDSLNTITSNAYEPIWEKHIGKSVEIEIFEDESINISGVLAEYSQSYILIFDAITEGLGTTDAHDLLISREYGTIRHVFWKRE